MRTLSLLLLFVSPAHAASYCDLRPLGPGCPAYCRTYRLDPACGGTAGENLCKLTPFAKGCPRFCEVHRLDPACR